MTLLPPSFRALVIGSSGTIGSAFVELLQADKACIEVVGIHRHSEYPIDYRHPETIEAAAKALSLGGPFQLIINTIGVLHSKDWMPEKKLADLNSEQLMDLMKINAIGPALTIQHSWTHSIVSWQHYQRRWVASKITAWVVGIAIVHLRRRSIC